MSNINLFPELDDEQHEEQDYSHASKQTAEDELIVFGYSCKLFRDDFSAKAQDRGQSLIPWNGDENVMIDRYDCRGHLFDLTIWDSELIKKKSNEPILNEDEQRIEDECDQERYCDLYRDMEKEALRQEEELKRLKADKNSFNQVGFSYDQADHSKKPSNKTTEETSQILDDDDEYEPFYPSEKLQIPYGMDIPESIKLNAVIEKTASFVSTSGLQMEIVIKTKQANNPQFDFLKYDHYLNPYYRHLIIMIKSGKYRPTVDNHSNNNQKKKQANKNGVDQNSSHDEDEGNDSYLHPLLRGGGGNNDQTNTMKKSDEPLRILSVPMNIHNTAYGQLIKKYEHLRQPAKVIKENEEDKMSPKIDESSPRSESSSSSGIVIPPPPDVKPIIDKLAEYVARNGQEFEQSIRTKNDERFAFLDRDHIHHNYYQLKLQLCLQENQRKKIDEVHQTPSDESIKLVLKSNKEKSLVNKTSQEFHSDDDSTTSQMSKDLDDTNGEFIGPRPPSPEFLEKMRKQEQRRDRLNEFVREKIVRDKQEERKRKAELLVQKLKNESLPSSTINSTTDPAIESTNLNSNLIEKLLNVKDERSSSSRLTSPHQTRRSKRSRSKSTTRSKYYRRSRSKSNHRRRRRSSHKRSRTRSKSRSRHRSKRSKNSKYSRSHRRHRRRYSSPSSPSSRSSSATSRSSSATSSSSSSSSHEKKKKKKSSTTDENQRKKTSQSSKWDQREPMKTKADDKDLSLSISTESTISNSITS